ncbi:cytochrome P450 [Salinibacterium sp.]|uniref:cytochrome P450 n=1 Tax=Salinibacterium sp. TaxID=1915057 RepID=UPI00286A685B|nr:cytochrome P450 [Salinibacterium sp.]
MTRPFTAPRPESYAPMPKPIRTRRSLTTDLPPGPRGFPVSITAQFLRDAPAFLLGLHRTYGDTASYFLNGELFFAFFGPEGVIDVTVKKQNSFVKGVGFDRMRKVLGTGLLTNEEPIHLRHRRMMQPPFHHAKLGGYATMMHRITREHLAGWDEGDTVEANREMMRLTFQIVAQLLFGTDIDRYADGVQHHMGLAIDRIERTMLPGLKAFDGSPIPYFKKFRMSSDYLADVADEIIANRASSGELGDDLLGLLLAARDEDESALSHDEVRDETLTLILSGHETTANVMTWALCYLRDRDDLWDALAAEADMHLPESGEIDLRGIMSAPTATAVMAESLRLAPPVWVAPRRAIDDVEVAGVAVPKGAHVIVSQYASHRNARFFPDPDSFRPERWADGFEASLPRGAYFPFGAGTRKCLGDQFALLESHIILMELARTARPIPVGLGLPKAEPRATYRPGGGVPAVVRQRPALV